MFDQKRLIGLVSASVLLTYGLVFAADTNSDPAQNSKNVQEEKAGNITPDDIKKASEAFGHFIGRNLNTPTMNFDIEKVILGIRNGAAGKPAPMPDKEYEDLMMRIQKATFENLSTANLKAADEFMAKNAHEQNIVEIEPGKLQYVVLTKGTGPVVEEHSTPSINYVGKYLDGTVFGSSEDTGGPITIPLDQTIPGFSKGIQGMKEGEKRRLFVHPSVGYGTMGHLPPNSLLIFDIELVKADTPKESLNEEDELFPVALEDDENEESDDADEQDHASLSTKKAQK
jgi:peptidylprolyl isomerase